MPPVQGGGMETSMRKNTIACVSKKDCTGCAACFNCCPANAITMKENFEGFLYPEIDEM